MAETRLGNNFRLYWRYIGISMRGQMQYRASFLMLSFGQLLATGMEFLAVWAMFARFGSLRGWRFPEVALFYGVTAIAFAFADGFGRGWDIFPQMVKSGEFDRVLLRPRSTALQVAGQDLQLMRVGRLAQGVVVLVWAISALPTLWTPGHLLLLAGMILGGACLFYGLFILQATLSFWTVETLEIFNAITYGGTETASYPLNIYKPWFQRFFTFLVPLACVNVIPAGALLPRADLQGSPPLWQWMAPFVGVVFLLVTLQVWKIGVRYYTSTGS